MAIVYLFIIINIIVFSFSQNGWPIIIILKNKHENLYQYIHYFYIYKKKKIEQGIK